MGVNVDVDFRVPEISELDTELQALISDVLANPDSRKLEDTEFIYHTQADERVRPEHAVLHGTVWDADDPNAPIPPIGYGCRCYIEYRARTKKGEEKKGLKPSPKKQPEPGEEALDNFFEVAKKSEKSNDTGAKVKPTDTFGEKTGKEIEAGNIKAIDAFDQDIGSVRSAGDVKDIARSTSSAKSIISGISILRGLGITRAAQTRIIALARAELKIKPALKDVQALFSAVLKLAPGISSSPFGIMTAAQKRRNARKIAKHIRKVNGPL